MAHYATSRYSYLGQFGILAAVGGAGLIIGAIASFIPLIGKIDFFSMKGGNTADLMNKLLVPENANALRWSQFLSTLFLFFAPPVVYAWICHKKPWLHLGFEPVKIDLKQVGIVILIMMACLPLVSAMQELTELYPWSKAMMAKFKEAEDAYSKQVMVMARMNDFTDYLIAVVIVALLPAVFEEVLFRGAIQNLLSRWFKLPVLAVIVTSIIFSAIHGSYLGFLSRFVLGFALGWMYYRTGNIWLNIIAHFVNNAVAVTALYLSHQPGQKIDPSKIEEPLPIWWVAVSLVAIPLLLVLFEKVIKKDVDRPGEEVLIPGYNFSNDPFANDIASKEPQNQSFN
ncbi:MAG: CPBP family intramembrane metalloprotease [Ferruginibacter sp.]